jgi:hypothetical protein
LNIRELKCRRVLKLTFANKRILYYCGKNAEAVLDSKTTEETE